MKRLFQLSLILFCTSALVMLADGKSGSELQRKSELKETTGATSGLTSSYPLPFNEFGQQYNRVEATASTGYYFYDNEEAPLVGKDIWHPGILKNDPKWRTELDTVTEQKYWTRILAGPRIWDPTFWANSQYGKYYFRNPADGLSGSIFDTRRDDLDSTNNAIAGPMPMGISDGFYFNGLRYDSFYVSTNGAIALTNRRYIYNNDGKKEIPAGATHCYDINSMDWFVGGATSNYPDGTRRRVGNMNGDPSNGVLDAIADNFGYNYAVLGGDPTRKYETPVDNPVYTKTAGLRHDMFQKSNLTNVFGAGYGTQLSRPAIISPFWGRLSMSHYNKTSEKAEDYSKVYFKYSPGANKLTIAYYNISMWGQVVEPPTGTSYTIDPDSRLGEDGYFEWDAKVVFDKLDSSVTFIYENFRGGGKFNGASAGDMLRANSIAGVLGWARGTNYSTKNPAQAVQPNNTNYPWYNEYMQYTHYYSHFINDINQAPYEGTAVKFKQWRNVTRAADIAFRVRNEKTAANPQLDFTVDIDAPVNYELLAGEQLLGAIQPVVMVQNLSNDSQGPKGVNFIAQDYNFYAQFRLQNTTTGRMIYSKTIPVSKQCMSVAGWQGCYQEEGASVKLVNSTNTSYPISSSLMTPNTYMANGFTGVPPYYFAQVRYPMFEANEFTDDHIGRMKATLISQAWKSGQDAWPFDDTVSTYIYVMKRLKEFSGSASDFHTDLSTNIPVPSPLRWVSVNADIVSGESISQHPLPPRGTFNNITSPVIRMNRTITLPNGAQTDKGVPGVSVYVPYAGYNTYYGDELRSFPIDIRQKHGAVLSLSVQRGNNYYDGWMTGKSRVWGEELLHGPEARSIGNGNVLSNGYVPGSANNFFPDMLVVEFATPSNDGVQGICNIPDASWRFHPQKRGTNEAPITKLQELTIFGGGGTMVGFLETEKDSAMGLPNTVSPYGLRADVYDTGVDYEFKKYFVSIPDTFVNWKNDGARNFRFRIRTLARNNQISPLVPTEFDDTDDFFVDNVKLTFPTAKTDIGVTAVRVDWPYAYTPASQLTALPVTVKVSNNTSLTAPGFNVKLQIYRTDDFDKNTQKAKTGKKPIYCRVEAAANFGGGQELELRMPSWDIRKHGEGKYTLVATIQFPEGDLDPTNDVTFADQFVGFGEYYQYESSSDMQIDPLTDSLKNFGINDVAIEQKLVGKGLSLPAYSVGTAVGPEQQVGAGIGTDATSGKVAVKFQVFNTDTIKGYNIYFGALNGAPDLVELSLVKNIVDPVTGQDMPGIQIIPGSSKQHYRGVIDGKYSSSNFDEYNQYPLTEPIELATGIYWMVMMQTAPDPMALGASGDRTAMRVMNYSGDGILGQNIYLDRTLRVEKQLTNGTTKKVNGNYFCYSNGNSGDTWIPFTPNAGNLAYPRTDHTGLSQVDKRTYTYTNASWVPMFQPYFGPRESGQEADSYEECPGDHVPVELESFYGVSRSNGIELVWATASEINNAGFEVERRVKGSNAWSLKGIVDGQGNSSSRQYYNHFDYDVKNGETYTYRLTQIDKDGTISCNKSDEVTIKYDFTGELELAQNSPNPFNYNTSIRYELTSETNYKLEVLDMYGRVVSVLSEGVRPAGKYSADWYAIDNDGNSVANGTYFYRLTAGDKVITNKMTYIK